VRPERLIEAWAAHDQDDSEWTEGCEGEHDDPERAVVPGERGALALAAGAAVVIVRLDRAIATPAAHVRETITAEVSRQPDL